MEFIFYMVPASKFINALIHLDLRRTCSGHRYLLICQTEVILKEYCQTAITNTGYIKKYIVTEIYILKK